MTLHEPPEEDVEDVTVIFPGAIFIANLLRTVAWFVVVLCVLSAASRTSWGRWAR